MTIEHLLLASQAAQWALLIHHLLRCRDIRKDLYVIQVRLGLKS